MPGLSQLKKFNSDMLSLGKEATVRAHRGEKPVTLPVPQDIPDEDDSDFFLRGLPEPPSDLDKKQENKPDTQEEDFSDITGISKPEVTIASPSNSEESPVEPSIDLSGLMDIAPEDSQEEGFPDLSMFEEEPEEVRETPVEDMGLEALLGGSGFDGSIGAKEETDDDSITEETSGEENIDSPIESETEDSQISSPVEPQGGNESNDLNIKDFEEFSLDDPIFNTDSSTDTSVEESVSNASSESEETPIESEESINRDNDKIDDVSLDDFTEPGIDEASDPITEAVETSVEDFSEPSIDEVPEPDVASFEESEGASFEEPETLNETSNLEGQEFSFDSVPEEITSFPPVGDFALVNSGTYPEEGYEISDIDELPEDIDSEEEDNGLKYDFNESLNPPDSTVTIYPTDDIDEGFLDDFNQFKNVVNTYEEPESEEINRESSAESEDSPVTSDSDSSLDDLLNNAEEVSNEDLVNPDDSLEASLNLDQETSLESPEVISEQKDEDESLKDILDTPIEDVSIETPEENPVNSLGDASLASEAEDLMNSAVDMVDQGGEGVILPDISENDDFFKSDDLDSFKIEDVPENGISEISQESTGETADLPSSDLDSSDSSFDLPDLNFDLDSEPSSDTDSSTSTASNNDSVSDMSSSLLDPTDSNETSETLPDDTAFDLPDMSFDSKIQDDNSEPFGGMDFNMDDISLDNPSEDSGISPIESTEISEDLQKTPDTEDSLDSAVENLDGSQDDFELPPLDDSSLEVPNADDLSLEEPSIDDSSLNTPESIEPNSQGDSDESFGDLDLSMDFDNPSGGDLGNTPVDASSETLGDGPSKEEVAEALNTEDFKTSDFGDSTPEGLFDASDLDVPDFGSDTSESSDISVEGSVSDGDDPLSDFNFDLDDAGGSDDNGASFEENAVHEDVDISQMDGMDFSTQGEGSGFELGSSDDFQMENGDFEIPGFSDVQTVMDVKPGPPKEEEEEEEEVFKDEDGTELPPNTLSDSQYKRFLKNLQSYPLNVRIAVEDLFDKNEFTDEAEFEIVQKILKKVPARTLASDLEKMLDIALSVPRDFERRSAEEYELYKSSFQYQLKARIIPGIICGTAACIALFFMATFSYKHIYKPCKASSLYKQGYALLETKDYPQSELLFNEASSYNLQKKWCFRYAEGYRDHKQYIRAEAMYKKILYNFKHDKRAGLAYAHMELDDLANYEESEKILRREVLDYYINDQDALTLLGDTFLEWATEKDPEKYEDARETYSELISLYGQTNTAMSRMLRYFIRTDNLLEVLTLKERFMPEENSLGSSDWTELSGFLLDKIYGVLPPSEEYLRTKIEDVKETLLRAIRADESNPVALYNLSRYYVHMNNSTQAKSALEYAISFFGKAPKIKKKDMYKYIDSYRLLGEQYVEKKEYLKARELFTEGLHLYLSEHDNRGFGGNEIIGKLFADNGDIDYFIAGDYDSALLNYKDSIETFNDTPEVRYKVGFIQYNKKNYAEALGSFMKASEEYPSDTSLLLAMGNTLSLRNDNYASQGYYERLLDILKVEKDQKGVLFPQVKSTDAELVDSYLKASNNLGVTLFRLARRTGNSSLNAQSIACLQESVRAWDSMTRNQVSMTRLGGSNLAEENIKYVSHPISSFEPAIYTDLARTLTVEEALKQ